MLLEKYDEISDTETIITFFDGQHCILKITEILRADSIIMAAQGEFRSEVANSFADELTAAVLSNKSIELNFNDVSHISYAVLSELLNAQLRIEKIHLGKMELTNVPNPVFNSIRAAGMEDLLWIKD